MSPENHFEPVLHSGDEPSIQGRARSTALRSRVTYDGWMSREDRDPERPLEIKRARAVLYVSAVCTRTLIGMVAVALFAAPWGLVFANHSRGAQVVGPLVAAGLALLGLGLPLIAHALSRADWIGATALFGRKVSEEPYLQIREPRTYIRPLAYTVIMLTLGGAIAVIAALLVVASAIALISPILTAVGDQVVIGPFTVATVPQSMLAAGIAVGLLVGLIIVSPHAARAHVMLVLHVLPRPEQRLQRTLSLTTQSRARLVRAFDVERRRIERDLHDGVQPQLMSISMTLGLALAEMPAHSPGRDDVARAQQQTRQTLENLRRFVRNIHPQVLIDHGLGAAIGELADSLTIPITIEDQLSERVPSDIETNLYFCVAELLTNVVKHSGATQAEICLYQPSRELVGVRVFDDGRGGAASPGLHSGGLNGIADRIAAFDGTLEIESPLGGPTTIIITLEVLRNEDDNA